MTKKQKQSVAERKADMVARLQERLDEAFESWLDQESDIDALYTEDTGKPVEEDGPGWDAYNEWLYGFLDEANAGSGYAAVPVDAVVLAIRTEGGIEIARVTAEDSDERQNIFDELSKQV